MTTIDRLLAIIGTGLWVSLVLAVVVVVVAIRRNRGTEKSHVEAYQIGWTAGTLDALRVHGPTTDYPDARLLWITGIDQAEANPYLGGD